MTKKRLITVAVDCDTDRLYGTLDEAIRYISEVRDAHPGHSLSLSENWTGYDSMEMQFIYYRDETDDEMNSRLLYERRAAVERNKRMWEDEARDKRRREYELLKREFGA